MCSNNRLPPKRVTFDLPCGTSDSAVFSTSMAKNEILHEQSSMQKNRVAQDKLSVPKKSSSIKKVFVRHAESELPSERVVSKIPGEIHLTEDTESNLDVPRSYKTRYAVPELFSALCIAKEFQDKKEEQQNVKCLPIPVSIKQVVDGKAASKLNFSPEEQLFKDLVNLDVNDEMLVGVAEERPATWKLPKDEEPKLSDFYQPKFVGEYTSLSEPTFTAIGKIRNYNGFSTHKRRMSWTLTENLLI